MRAPTEADLERLFDRERAAEIRFADVVTSWASLRVLDHLYAHGAATTGEIARELNMDMRDVKDRLDALEEVGVVDRETDAWHATTDRVTITLERNDGLDVSHTTSDSRPADDTESAGESEEPSIGSRVRQIVASLLP